MEAITNKRFSPLVEKVIGWGIITLLSLGSAVAVSKSRLDLIEKSLAVETEYRRTDDRQAITRPEFQQFKEGLYQRLDRIERKIDEQKERQRT